MAEIAEIVHLKEVWHQPIDTLSKGYKRRVGLAQAMLHDPPVLILDEPTDGLDPNQKHEVRKLVQTMAETKAIIISTLILEEVDAICDRALIIDRGRIVADGPPGTGRPKPASPCGFATEIGEALQRGPGVDRGESRPDTPQTVQLTALPAGGIAILEGIREMVAQRNLRIFEMIQEQGRLDESILYRSLIEKNAFDRRHIFILIKSMERSSDNSL